MKQSALLTNMPTCIQTSRMKWQENLKRKGVRNNGKIIGQSRSLEKKIVAFRVSEEEARIIDDKVALSGLTKQEYIIRRLCEKKIVVNGNPKVYIALKKRLNDVYEELKRITGAGEVDDVLLEVIELIGVTMNGMKEDKNNE